MRRLLLAALALLIAPSVSAAPPANTPTLVLQRNQTMQRLCVSMGGRPGQGDRPYVYNQIDLNGDGREDWVMDSAGFGCIGKPNLFHSPSGNTLEVFTGEGPRQARSAWIGTVQAVRIDRGRNAAIYITQHGVERRLVWNAGIRKFAPGNAGPVIASGAPQVSFGGGVNNAGPGGASGFSGPPFKISAADTAAAMHAAGFKQTRRGWQRCTDDEGASSPSYTPGEATTPDLNNDGRPELQIHEGGAICYGNSGGLYVIVAKSSVGQWTVIFDNVTDPTVLKTRHNGWVDIRDGGPGMGPWGTWTFNGRKYVGRNGQ